MISSLVNELQELARASDSLSVSKLDFPELRRRAKARYGAAGTDELHTLVHDSVAGMPDRERAAALMLFGDSADRWRRNLTERRRLAADEFGMSADKFRKKRAGRSPYDDLTTAVARSIEGIPSDGNAHLRNASRPSSGSPEPAEPKASTEQGTRLIAVLATGAAIGALAVAVWVVSHGDSSGPETESPAAADRDRTTDSAQPVSSQPESSVAETTATITRPGTAVDGCDIPVAAAFGAAAPSEDLTEALADAYLAAEPEGRLGCPLAVVERWGDLWVQPIADGDGSAWWIVARESGGEALVLTGNLYDGYFRIAAPDGSLAQATGGLPVAVDTGAEHPRLDLETGGVVIAENATAPARWMVPEAVEIWEELGGADSGLGLPLTDANFVAGVPRQEFEYGYGVLTETSNIEATVLTTDQIAADVASLERQRIIILETLDRTSWWIDTEGVRHWIPDAATWSCLGGEEAQAREISPAWVVAGFPLGDISVCS